MYGFPFTRVKVIAAAIFVDSLHMNSDSFPYGPMYEMAQVRLTLGKKKSAEQLECFKQVSRAGTVNLNTRRYIIINVNANRIN